MEIIFRTLNKRKKNGFSGDRVLLGAKERRIRNPFWAPGFIDIDIRFIKCLKYYTRNGFQHKIVGLRIPLSRILAEAAFFKPRKSKSSAPSRSGA